MIRVRKIGRGGFSLVESVLAVCLMSAVMVSTSHLFLKTMQAKKNAGSARRATALARMVFEQYNSYAADQWSTLPLKDKTAASPATFFGQTTNLGYDGMLITTHSEYSTNHSTCVVSVTVGWNDQSSKPFTFTRMYTETTAVHGGAVIAVQAKIPCNGLTDPMDIAASCPGLVNARVSATNEEEHSTVEGLTDVNGNSVLTGVVAGNSILVQVTSPLFTDTAIPPTSPSYKHAYYAISSSGTYSATVSSYTVVEDRAMGSLLFHSLRPTGVVSGQLTNNSGPSEPLGGMTVSVGAPGVAAVNGGFRLCGIEVQCATQSDTSGNFYLSNVVPAALSFHVNGRPGSLPNIAQSDPRFDWGYTGKQHIALQASDWGQGDTPALSVSGSVDRMGWLKIMIVDEDGNRVPNAVVSVETPWTPWRGQMFFDRMPTDANGELMFYNVIYSTPSNVRLVGDDAAGSMHGDETFSLSGNAIGRQSDLTLRLKRSYTVTFELVDMSPTASPTRMQGMSTWAFGGPDGPARSGTLTDASGHFTVENVCITCFAARQGVSEAGPISMYIWENKAMSPPFTAGVHATVHDQQNPSQIAPGARFVSSTKTGWYFLQADAMGVIDVAPVLQYDWGQGQYAQITCDTTARTCHTITPVTINTNTSAASIYDPASWYPADYHGWHLPTYDWSFPIIDGQVSTGVDIPAVLKEFLVSGIVTDETGTPLSGIRVQDASDPSNYATTASAGGTDPVGSYRLWTKVQNRSSLDPGTVKALILPGQMIGSQKYSGTSTNDLTVPTPADINVPINKDLQIFSNIGSHA